MREEIQTLYKQTNDPNFYDRILRELKKNVVVVGSTDLNEFPQVTSRYGKPVYLNNKDIVTRNIFEV